MIYVGTSFLSGTTTLFKDGFTLAASHELAETISDPGGIATIPSQSYGIVVTPPAGLPSTALVGNGPVD